ncbi:LPXTG cell wall anchor domain-containing protein [Nosocomiicoccus massiliensis]|uniref:LPXTG cell wall anchor domain-containing protein n=1 Tax=Nosocomiicoccus massiliensis TaxID=1232430 RepID=A0AAF0YNC0_9STAP|nr:LPXTG cell wall anchor domain-containing protein [Nosocomiicoccus massiliensis]WOS96959.1 LPXTG cell wall anchor domain-containing protein [Nosocomiicoccus massiliensis]
MKLKELLLFSVLIMLLIAPVSSADEETNASDTENSATQEETKQNQTNYADNPSEAPDESTDSDNSNETEKPQEPETPETNEPGETDNEDTKNPPNNNDIIDTIDEQVKEADDNVLDAIGVEEKPGNNNPIVSDDTLVTDNSNTDTAVTSDKESNKKSTSKSSKDSEKKKTPHGAKELPDTGVNENIELLYVIEIILLSAGLMLLVRKTNKIKIKK